MSLNRTLIDVIIRQTDYTEEKAIDKLTEHKNDVLAIVREYMGVVKPPTRNETIKSSTNQQIFSEIRNLMDDAAKTYQAKKAYEQSLSFNNNHWDVKHNLDRVLTMLPKDPTPGIGDSDSPGLIMGNIPVGLP